jgi:hypothetical protein
MKDRGTAIAYTKKIREMTTLVTREWMFLTLLTHKYYNLSTACHVLDQ